MTDAHLLRYIIRKNGETVDDLAAAMEMSRATLSAKMNNKREFKTSEVIFIVRRYKLSLEMCAAIFAVGELLCV
jgi:hypothetical protein